jgi:isocitrate dehydrogenase
MTTSVLVIPKDSTSLKPHGTVQKHYYKHLKGENFKQLYGADFRMARLPNQKRTGQCEVVDFARKPEQAALETVENGHDL